MQKYGASLQTSNKQLECQMSNVKKKRLFTIAQNTKYIAINTTKAV